MKSNIEIFLGMFEKASTAEDCPVGVELLVWDGCDFHLDYVEICGDTGGKYFANKTSPVSYIQLPDGVEAFKYLGDGS